MKKIKSKIDKNQFEEIECPAYGRTGGVEIIDEYEGKEILRACDCCDGRGVVHWRKDLIKNDEILSFELCN